MDLDAAQSNMIGRGGVTVITAGHEHRFAPGESLSLNTLGAFRLPNLSDGLPADVLQEAVTSQTEADMARSLPPDEVIALVEARQAARTQRNWAMADALRQKIAEAGWSVQDTPDGPRLEPQPT
jgi:hypothetical protein